MIYITKREGIDDVVIGKITDCVESNDEELTELVREIIKLKTYEKRGNKKIVSTNQMMTNLKNKLCFPFGLTTNARVEFEIYRDKIYATKTD